MTTSGNFAVDVGASNGGAVTITGTTVTSNGNGAQGLFVTGTGSIMTASGLTITANGSFDPISGVYAGGASNNGFGGVPNGGTLEDGVEFDDPDDRRAELRRLHGQQRDDHPEQRFRSRCRGPTLSAAS